MAKDKVKRKLSAILCADVVEYSRLMAEDEAATLQALKSCTAEIIEPIVKEHNGRIFKQMGDGFFIEFSSAVDSVECAIDWQDKMMAQEQPLHFRIGINLGDVIDEDDDMYGDGVNVAARIEKLADPGGICISRGIFDQIKKKINVGFEYLGEQEVKNISEPVRVYRLLTSPEDAGKIIGEDRQPVSIKRRRKGFAASMITLAVVVGLVLWQVYEYSNKGEPNSIVKEGTVFPTADKPSIAVLPFKNMTGDPQQQYLSDGMTQQIITGLSQGSHVYVSSRPSSFALRGKDMKFDEIAKELGVQYLLEGGVQKDDERVRINVQLIDGATGNHVWAEHYDHKSEDLFTIQDNITMEVMGAVGVNTSGFKPNAYFRNVRPSNQDAYEYYLKAYYIHLGRKTKEIGLAIEAIEKAIEHDPDFAPAHFLSGFIYLDLIIRRVTKTPDEVIEKAILAAKRAEELDPDSPPNLLWSHIYRIKKDYEKAVLYAEKAIKQQPNNPYYYYFFSLANLLGFIDFEAAKDALETGLQLIPFRPVNFLEALGASHLHLKDYDNAISVYNEVIERAPKSYFAYLSYKGLLLANEWSDNHDKAVEAAENIVRMNPKYSLKADKKLSPVKDGDYKEKIFATYQKAGLPE